jgi:predicted HNH restriction endonuclease
MAKKNPMKTPRSKVVDAVRRLFMRSRERGWKIKQQRYCCEICGAKQSKAKGREVKIEVHHRSGIGNWAAIAESIYKTVLNLADLQVLCEKCHDKQHAEKKE